MDSFSSITSLQIYHFPVIKSLKSTDTDNFPSYFCCKRSEPNKQTCKTTTNIRYKTILSQKIIAY